MARIVVDPVTRIEGHLRVDVEVSEGRSNKSMVFCSDVSRY
jgi:Ni,Fe-hydrogenase I large subunit